MICNNCYKSIISLLFLCNYKVYKRKILLFLKLFGASEVSLSQALISAQTTEAHSNASKTIALSRIILNIYP